jgi:hypothetical protein
VQVDVELLKEFERGLDPAHPEQSKIPARVLGYGEISTIFEIQSDSVKNLACKRLPIFQTRDEVERYEQIYRDYNEILEKKTGINVPDYGFAWFTTDAGRIIAFDVQQKLPSASIGNRAIALLTQRIFEHFLCSCCMNFISFGFSTQPIRKRRLA